MDDWVPKRLLEALGCDAMDHQDVRTHGMAPRGLPRGGGGVPGPGRLDLRVPAEAGKAVNEAGDAAARAMQTKADAISAGRIALLQALGLASAIRTRQRQGMTQGQAAAEFNATPQQVRRALRLVWWAVRTGKEPKEYYSTLDEHGARELMTLMEAEMVAGIRDLETGQRLAEYAE